MKKLILLLALSVVLGKPIEVYAASTVNLKSVGKLSLYKENNDNLKIDSSDLLNLEINLINLEETCKDTIVKYINELDKNDKITDIVSKDSNGNYKDFETIATEILNTQQVVDSDLTVYKTISGALTNDSTEIAVTVGAATANNLSVGARAWVNGEYIEGNGHDNDYYYDLGYADGQANLPNASVEYIYHEHVNGKGEVVTTTPLYTTTNPGGCYKASGHTHNKGGATCEWGTIKVPNGTCKCTVGNDDWEYEYQCSCGHWHDDGEECGATIYKTTEGYKCNNSPTNTYKLTKCGKTTSTIEKAIIVYD